MQGRPVAVGYAAKRGVVAAASYEARAFGVRSAMPSSTALRKCPDLVFVPPRFEIYRAVPRQIHSIFADYTALIEPLSLDEAYLDVTENLRGISTAVATAAEIRARIFDETGLTASAGISYNKLLAKLSSDRRKPNGQFVVTPAMGAAFVEALPVGKFHGVGPVTASKMNRLGIFTGADLRRQSLASCSSTSARPVLGITPSPLAKDDRPVVPDRPRRSSGSETTFSNDLTDPADIEAGVQAMADEVWAWCEKARAFGRTVTVKIKYADFQQATRSRTLPAIVASQDALHDVSIALVRTVFPPAKGIRLVGVTLSSFERPDSTSSEQLELGLGMP